MLGARAGGIHLNLGLGLFLGLDLGLGSDLQGGTHQEGWRDAATNNKLSYGGNRSGKRQTERKTAEAERTATFTLVASTSFLRASVTVRVLEPPPPPIVAPLKSTIELDEPPMVAPPKSFEALL